MNEIRRIHGAKLLAAPTKAGPALDRLIDREVMGFDRSPDLALPPYSSKWAYAMEVVEALSMRWALSLVISGDRVHVIFTERWPVIEGQSKQVHAQGMDGPGTICMAALNVKRQEKPTILTS